MSLGGNGRVAAAHPLTAAHPDGAITTDGPRLENQASPTVAARVLVATIAPR